MCTTLERFPTWRCARRDGICTSRADELRVAGEVGVVGRVSQRPFAAWTVSDGER